MSIVYIKRPSVNAMLGLWHINESVEELLKSLHLSDADFVIYNSKKTDARKKEWLACRNLLKKMIDKKPEIKYDLHGKPHLANASYYISISHSEKYACVYLHRFRSVGVDIQKLKLSIKDGSDFYLNEKEKNWVDLNDNVVLHIIWSVKETVFKYCGIAELNIKKDIVLNLFNSNQNGIIEVNILNYNQKKKILIDYEVFDGYVLTKTT